MKQERNATCACGSGAKYKKCCLLVERESARLARIERKERMRRRVEEIRRRRELALDKLKTNPGAIEHDPVLAAISMAAMIPLHRRVMAKPPQPSPPPAT